MRVIRFEWLPAILLVYKSVCVGLCSMPTASPCFLVICSLSDNCVFVLCHVNPAVALLRVLTPCSASREALKDCVVKCKCPLVLHFKQEFPPKCQAENSALNPQLFPPPLKYITGTESSVGKRDVVAPEWMRKVSKWVLQNKTAIWANIRKCGDNIQEPF